MAGGNAQQGSHFSGSTRSLTQTFLINPAIQHVSYALKKLIAGTLFFYIGKLTEAEKMS